MDELVEGDVRSVRNKFLVQAVDALGMRPVLAQPLHLGFFVLGIEAGAVETAASGPVIASGLAFGFVFFAILVLGSSDAVEALPSFWVVAFRVILSSSMSGLVLLELRNSHALMGFRFLGIPGADLHDGSVLEIGHIIDLFALGHRQHTAFVCLHN